MPNFAMISPHAAGNRLLANLPNDEFERLREFLEPVALDFERVVYEFGASIDSAYFPVSAVFSALTVMEDGTAIEVANVGNEGLVGHLAATVAVTSVNKVIVQIGGGAWRIDSRTLRAEVARSGALRELSNRYHAAFLSQVSQSVACNGLHRLEQRCCRWLLATQDRVGSDDLKLTHEFLAIMLGARRASVTEVLRPLQEADLVRSHRGRIIVLNRVGLEQRACECYRAVKNEYGRLIRPLRDAL